MTDHPYRCIQIGHSNVQGPCEVLTIHNHRTGEPEPTGRGTIDLGDREITGPLIAQVRGNRHTQETKA